MDRQESESGKPVPRCGGCKFKTFAAKYAEAARENRKLKKRLRHVLSSVKNFKSSMLLKWGRNFEKLTYRAKEGMLEAGDIPIANKKFRLVLIQESMLEAKMRKSNRYSKEGMLTAEELKKYMRLIREELGEDLVCMDGRRKTAGATGGSRKSKRKNDGRGSSRDGDKKGAGKSPSDSFGRKSRRLPDLDLPESMDIGSDISDEELDEARKEEVKQQSKEAMNEYFDGTSGEDMTEELKEKHGKRKDEDGEVGEA